MDPVNISSKFEVRITLPVPEIIAIEVLGGGCYLLTHSLGEEEAVRGRVWYRSKVSW